MIKTEYKLFGTYENPISSNKKIRPELIQNIEITYIKLITTNKKIYFYTTNPQIILEFEVGLGKHGISEKNQGKFNDKKTPKGDFKICGIRVPEKPGKQVHYTPNPDITYGPIFICLDAKIDNQLRGIAIHGSHDNSLRDTSGCIRMYNGDLLLLQNKIKKGIDIFIE